MAYVKKTLTQIKLLETLKRFGLYNRTDTVYMDDGAWYMKQ